ncbi:unnamed protein product [Closterium sp. NIES-64]|nr:unnamed protein product [Closterium sp. NIES-64]
MPPGAATPMEQQAELPPPLSGERAQTQRHWRSGGDGAVASGFAPPILLPHCLTSPPFSSSHIQAMRCAALLAFGRRTRQRAALLAFWEAMGRSKGLRASGWGKHVALPCDPRAGRRGGACTAAPQATWTAWHVDGISELPLKGPESPQRKQLQGQGPESPQGKELQGQVPWAGMTALSRLTMLDLSFNQARGPPVTPAVAAFTALQTLQLQYNKLTGPVPAVIGSLPALQILELGYNQLSGPLPSTLGLLPSLQALYVLPHLPLQALYVLSASFQATSRQFPGSSQAATRQLCQAPPHLFSNITGSLPASLLRAFSCLSSPFNSHSPIPLSSPPYLCPLLPSLLPIPYSRIPFSNITGSLPASLSRLSALSSLRLTQNLLAGPLPANLSALTALTELKVSVNALSATLPASWKILVSQAAGGASLPTPSLVPLSFPPAHPCLPCLGVSEPSQRHAASFMGKALVAPAPGPSLAPFSNLPSPLPTPLCLPPCPASSAHPPPTSTVKVSVNSLSGSLPASWSKLSALRQLAASSNNITGPFPAFLLSLPSIEEMDIGLNYFNGSVPPALDQPRLHVSHLGMSHGHVTWACHMGMSPGHVTWACHMGMSPGHVTWACHMGMSRGHVTWACHLGMSPGHVTWACHLGMSNEH